MHNKKIQRTQRAALLIFGVRGISCTCNLNSPIQFARLGVARLGVARLGVVHKNIN